MAATTCSPGSCAADSAGGACKASGTTGAPYYRCKFPDDYGIGAQSHPKIGLRQGRSGRPRARRLARRAVRRRALDHTCEVLAGAAEPDPDYEARQADLEAKIRDCDRRLARYRAALEHVESEIVPVVGWIAEVQRERKDSKRSSDAVFPAAS